MNVLIIGLGSVAKKHIEALELLPYNFSIYALRSNKLAAKEKNVVNIFDLEQIDIIFDFAIISNPTSFHFNFIERLAIRGIPLFIEKPAVDSLENIDKLIAIVKKNKLLTFVACNLRFHPCLQYLKNLIDSNKNRINEINVYCGSYLPDWRPQADFRDVYSAKASLGGGVHLDLFHEIDYTAWIFGIPIKSNSRFRSESTLSIDSIDYANYYLQYDKFSANIVLNYYRRQPKRIIDIVFENESLTVDLIQNQIKNDMGKIIFNVRNFSINQTYFNQLEYFVGFLNSGKNPMNCLSESIEILKI